MVIACMTVKVTAEAAVSGLKQTDDYTSSVTVEWLADPGSTYYGVELAKDSGFTQVVYRGATTSNSRYISGLAQGTKYYVRVGSGSSSSDCYGNWSSIIEVVTRPGAVTGPRFIGANSKQATIEYSAPQGGADAYLILDAANNPVAQTAATKVTFTVNQNISSNRYYIYSGKVSREGYAAVSSSYASVTVNLLTTGKISKKNFGVTSVASSSKKMTVTALYSGTGFQVQLVNSGGTKYSKTFKSSSAKSFTMTGSTASGTFKANKFLKYRVRAYVQTDAGVKYGKWSDYKAFCSVKGKSSMRYGSKKVNLSWSKVNGSGRFKIMVATSQKATGKKFATLKGTSKKATVTKYGKSKLKKGKTYYIKIVPEVKIGKSYVASDYIGYTKVTIR